MAYLDHAATTPMLPEAAEAVAAALLDTGNPSSLHAAGRKARRAVEESRERVAAAIGAKPYEVVFTGGGTESDNLAIKGIYWARRAADPRRRRVLASAVEHHAVVDSVEWLARHEGADVTWLPVGTLRSAVMNMCPLMSTAFVSPPAGGAGDVVVVVVHACVPPISPSTQSSTGLIICSTRTVWLSA